MYFESLDIRGFGCLRTSVKFTKDKLNLVIADNEAGKSTLVDVLLAAFYGIETDNRKSNTKRPHYKHVLPWLNPNEFGFILDFVAEDVHWRIERDFNSNSVKVIDLNNEKDLSAHYHKGRGKYHIGEDLLGLSCDNFLKSFYLRQEDASYIRKAGDLTSHVQKIASVADEKITSDAAVERLQQSLLKYPLSPTSSGLNIDNTIKRFKNDLDSVNDEIRSLDRRRMEIEPDCTRLVEIERNLHEANNKKDKYQRFADRTELEELTTQLNYQNDIQRKIELLEQDSLELKIYSEFPANKWETLISLTTSYNDISTSIVKLEEDLGIRAIEPLKELEKESFAYEDLQAITEQDLHELEASVSRLDDRRSRFIEIRKERNQLNRQMQNEGYNKDDHEHRNDLFQNLDHDKLQFVNEYSKKSDEEEQAYRSSRAARGALQERKDRSISANNRKRGKAKMVLSCAAAIAIIAGTTLIISHGAWYGLLLGGLCIITMAIGFAMYSSAATPRSSEITSIDMELAVVVNKEKEAQKKLEIMNDELEQIATKLGFDNTDILLNEYAEFKQIDELIRPLLNIERELDTALQYALEAIEMVRPFFEKAGKKSPEGADAVHTIHDFLERCRVAVNLNVKIRSLLSLKEQMNADIEKLLYEKDESYQGIKDILKLSGIESDLNPAEAVEVFREALEKYREYRIINQEKLPPLLREVISEDSLSEKEKRLVYLQNKLKDMEKSDTPKQSTEFYREKIENEIAKIETFNEEKNEINRRISAVYDQYQATYPELLEKRDKLEEKIQRAKAFRDEIEISIEIMKEIAQQVYGSWAVALSEETTPLLEALNPAYTNIRFNDNLTFRITDNRRNKDIFSEELENILSSGARDEVFLAVRLGIARYLSRTSKDTLPIVLDEPLAMADDERFLNGMKFFLDPLSNDHQVLIMSCHEQRHIWLKEQLPDLFKNKVHIVNIGLE
ncbi:AAA family ATPase [bacterium]|nr:AAA family ATPase [bacterium]